LYWYDICIQLYPGTCWASWTCRCGYAHLYAYPVLVQIVPGVPRLPVPPRYPGSREHTGTTGSTPRYAYPGTPISIYVGIAKKIPHRDLLTALTCTICMPCMHMHTIVCICIPPVPWYIVRCKYAYKLYAYEGVCIISGVDGIWTMSYY
jgi:hypothetical protein